ncbi:Leucine--tRNA ligase [uncultured archaeon]|nr:Leucine--tRNA ligase [uncultured archaeon]
MALKRIGKEVKKIKVINSPSLESDNPAQFICEKVNATENDREGINKAVKEIYKIEFYEGILNENCEEFNGMKVSEVKNKLTEKFVSQGKAIKIYEPTIKAKCRCGTSIIVATLENQWFLDFNHDKAKVKQCLDYIKIIPDVYVKQFNDILDWLDKRPCARKRGLGTKLPQDPNWIVESLSDSTLYMTLYTIIDLIRENNVPPEKLDKQFFDYVFTGKVSGELQVDKNFAEKARQAFDYWYPINQRHTAIAHISNHLIFFVFAHAVLLEKKYWPEMISLNELVISEGAKMSKSKGNVVPILKLTQQHSVDVYRLYCLNSADLNGKMDYREKDISELYYSVQRLEAIVKEISEANASGKTSLNLKNVLNQFYRNYETGVNATEKMKLREYVQRVFYGNLNLLEANTKRLNESDKTVLKNKILLTWLKLLNPIIPHFTEEQNEKLSLSNGLVSLSEIGEIEEYYDEEIEGLENTFQKTLNDSRNLVQILRKKGRQVASMKVICSEKNEGEYFTENINYLNELFGVQTIIELKEDSKSEKAVKSIRGKPAIEVN